VKKDFALAEFELGQMYFHGTGVPQDFSEAIGWFRKAAAHGSASAQIQLGFAYRHGWGVKQDYAQAEKWYDMAAASSPVARHNLAVVLARIHGDPGDGSSEVAESPAGSAPIGAYNPNKSALDDGLRSGGFSLLDRKGPPK
jgi:TPR repeat protein